mgnify:CR=1 FL=1
MTLTKLTMLNNMVDADFIASLDIQQGWGLSSLDLKEAIFGKSLIDMTLEEAREADKAIRDRSMSVYCFSTELFRSEIELGESYFKTEYLNRIGHLLDLAYILKPKVIRLLAARTSKRALVDNSVTYIAENHAWVMELYREAIDRISEAGFEVTIENESVGCIFSTPREIVDFFTELNRNGRVYFTYDVQNLWQMGTYPTMEVYSELAPYIGLVHVKGGQTGDQGDKLVWKSALEHASWPAADLIGQVLRDGRSPVICINPSHGKAKPGLNDKGIYKQDLDYMKQLITNYERQTNCIPGAER